MHDHGCISSASQGQEKGMLLRQEEDPGILRNSSMRKWRILSYFIVILRVQRSSVIGVVFDTELAQGKVGYYDIVKRRVKRRVVLMMESKLKQQTYLRVQK